MVLIEHIYIYIYRFGQEDSKLLNIFKCNINVKISNHTLRLILKFISYIQM